MTFFVGCTGKRSVGWLAHQAMMVSPATVNPSEAAQTHVISTGLATKPLIDTARQIETPEGVELALDVAGPYPRAVAWLVDWLIRVSVALVTLVLAGFLGAFGQGLSLLTLFVLLFGYPIFFEVLRGGMTPGKRVVGLAVVEFDGAPVGWRASVTRNLLRTADFMPVLYGLGLMSMLLGRDFQRLGDRAAGTLVVHVLRSGRVRPLPTVPARAPAQKLTRDDRRAIDSFGARLGDLSKPRARELAELVTPLTGATGDEAVLRLVGLARWLRGER